MDDWIDTHSVTCAICGGLADERLTVNLLANLLDERPGLERENPAHLIAVNTAVNEFGEGECHSECLHLVETHLLQHGGRFATEFEIEERNHR